MIHFPVVVVVVVVVLPCKEAKGDSAMRQSSSIVRIPAVGRRGDGGRIVVVFVDVLDVLDVDVDIVEIAATVKKNWIDDFRASLHRRFGRRALWVVAAAADVRWRGLSDWNCGGGRLGLRVSASTSSADETEDKCPSWQDVAEDEEMPEKHCCRRDRCRRERCRRD